MVLPAHLVSLPLLLLLSHQPLDKYHQPDQHVEMVDKKYERDSSRGSTYQMLTLAFQEAHPEK